MGIIISRQYSDPARTIELPGLLCENLVLGRTDDVIVAAETFRVYSAGFSFALVSRFSAMVGDTHRASPDKGPRGRGELTDSDLVFNCFAADGTALKLSKLGGRQSSRMHEVEYWVGSIPSGSSGSVRFVASSDTLNLEGSAILSVRKLQAAQHAAIRIFDS